MAEVLPDAPRRPVVVDPTIPCRDETDDFIVAHLPVAARLARRFSPDDAAWADSFQEACLGLMELVRYLLPVAALAPSHAEALAVLSMRRRIVGALARHAALSPSLSDSGVRHWVRMQRMRRMLAHRLGRDPLPAELAAALGLPLALVRDLLAVTAHPASLEALANAGLDIPTAATLSAEVEAQRLRVAVQRLPQPERFIIQAQFGIGMGHLAVAHLAHVLHMSPRHIIKLRRHGLDMLRGLLLDDET